MGQLVERLQRVLREPDRARVYLTARATTLRARLRYLILGMGQQPLKRSPVIYLKTPKCAGSSIVALLRAADRIVYFTTNKDVALSKEILETKVIVIGASGKHLFIERHPDIWRRAYKWAIVRNPQDRAISAWRYLEKLKHRPIEDVLDNPPQAVDSRAEYNHFTRTMWSMLSHEGELPLDRIVRYENLQNDLATVFAEIGIPYTPPPHVNRTVGKVSGERPGVSERARRKIASHFAEDFDAFDYPRPLP